jgi:DNA-binding transcriptional LysR family regulator
MEFAQLRAILAVRELASFAKAGEQLHLSASAVFCQIRQLEDEIGQKLYERYGKQLRMTAAGDLLAQHAARILEGHNAALAALREQCEDKRRLLRLGSGPHSSLSIVPHLLRAFLQAYPHTEVRLSTADDGALLRDLKIGVLDAVLMSMPVGEGDLEEVPLWTYEMVLVLPPGDSKPTLDEFRSLPFIVYRRALIIDAAYRQLRRDLGFEPNVVMENDEPDSIKQLVRLGLGAAFLPTWSVGSEARQGSLRVLRPPVRQFYGYGVLQRRSEYRPKVLTALLTVCSEWNEWWPLAEHVLPPHRSDGAGPLRYCGKKCCKPDRAG